MIRKKVAKYFRKLLSNKKDESKYGHTRKNDQTKTQFTRVSQISADLSRSGRINGVLRQRFYDIKKA